jgi:hypothetical protein
METHTQISSRRPLLGSCLATARRRYLVIRKGVDNELLILFSWLLFRSGGAGLFVISFSLIWFDFRFSKFSFPFDLGRSNFCRPFFQDASPLTLRQNGLPLFYSSFSCRYSCVCRQRLDKTVFFGGLRIWYVVLVLVADIFYHFLLDLPATSESGASGTLKIVRIRAWPRLFFFSIFC